MSGPGETLDTLPINALPYLTAAAKYSIEAWMAMFLGGDWSQAEAAFVVMQAEQNAWFGAAVAASSKAASEADYYAAVSLPIETPTEEGE